MINRFKFPLAGFITILRKDCNFILHLIAGIIVIIMGLLFKLNINEWLWMILAISMVLITEVINTSIEYVVDLYTDEYHPLAKHAKDTAAFAVLLASIMAVLIGVLIFLPKIINIF
ncbi:diacylglycerol kinase family protein [Mammaliicoccus sp. Dog046]|nr:diacylglycerol kinase family protein [Mammaliicoccus sp. Dog046]WQK86696.1 diacylglycerol kinase family protein [Mammaliicoccus sp. Dog046]